MSGSRLVRLSRLIMTDNSISTLTPSSATARTPRLTRLRHLDLTNNLIATWPSIHGLNELQELESLNMGGNPVVAGEEEEQGETSRLQLIGRVGRITRLEGTPARLIYVLP